MVETESAGRLPMTNFQNSISNDLTGISGVEYLQKPVGYVVCCQ
jgi:hypothetical protein